VRHDRPVHHDHPVLRELGWDDLLSAAAAEHPTATPARVSRGGRDGLLTVETVDGARLARLAARFRRVDPTDVPAVGDWVLIGDETVDGIGVMDVLLPRRGTIIRQAPADRGVDAQVLAANVDVAFVVVPLDLPANQRRLDRWLALVWSAGVTPVVVLSKADEQPEAAAAAIDVEAGTIGVEVIVCSVVSGEGLDAVRAHLAPGRTAVLLGASGAGKSTLANALLGTETLATGAVREDGRGRHTTTNRELLRLPGGGLVLDTPGLRELGLWDADEGLAETFGDVEELAAACRFADCAHATEPGCAVRAALEDGSLTAERHESWDKLRREQAHLARKQDLRLRQAQQRTWKTIHKAMRDHPSKDR